MQSLLNRTFGFLWSQTEDASSTSGKQYFPLGLSVGDLNDGEMREVTLTIDNIDRKPKIIVARVNGMFYATSNLCPHYKAPLIKGVLTSQGRLVCPWHAACFDVTTGEIEEAPSVNPLRSYKVMTKEDGSLELLCNLSDLTSTSPIHENMADICKTEIKADSCAQNSKRILILGGGAAGAVAAQSARSSGFGGEILILTSEPYLPIDRVKLSKFIQLDASKIYLYPEDHLVNNLGIKVHTSTTVESVDFKSSKVRLNGGADISYDALLLATGSEPQKIPIQGSNGSNVLVIREIKDCQLIQEELNRAPDNRPRIVIIGASWIGLESAAMLSKSAASITIVAPEKIPLGRILGDEVGTMIKKMHETLSTTVKFKLGVVLSKIHIDEQTNRATGIQLSDGSDLDADFIIMGVGVRPNTAYLRDSNIVLAKDQSVIVDEFMRVKDLPEGCSNVFAAGDLATFPLNGRDTRIEHWNVAQQQGRIAGQNMAHLLGFINGAQESGESQLKCENFGERKLKKYDSIPFFSSYQYGKSIRYVGSTPDGFDDVILQGDMEAFTFSAFYCREYLIFIEYLVL